MALGNRHIFFKTTQLFVIPPHMLFSLHLKYFNRWCAIFSLAHQSPRTPPWLFFFFRGNVLNFFQAVSFGRFKIKPEFKIVHLLAVFCETTLPT